MADTDPVMVLQRLRAEEAHVPPTVPQGIPAHHSKLIEDSFLLGAHGGAHVDDSHIERRVLLGWGREVRELDVFGHSADDHPVGPDCRMAFPFDLQANRRGIKNPQSTSLHEHQNLPRMAPARCVIVADLPCTGEERLAPVVEQVQVEPVAVVDAVDAAIWRMSAYACREEIVSLDCGRVGPHETHGDGDPLGRGSWRVHEPTSIDWDANCEGRRATLGYQSVHLVGD